jgi:hypothetical protein
LQIKSRDSFIAIPLSEAKPFENLLVITTSVIDFSGEITGAFSYDQKDPLRPLHQGVLLIID